MGKRRKNIFKKNNYFLNNKYNYLLNHIFNNFKFCSTVIIICKRADRKYLKFQRNFSKVEFIYLKSSKNQIETILKCKEKISNKNPIFILNPDSYFKFDKYFKFKQLLKNQATFFGIRNYESHSAINNKDTFKILNNKIKSIEIKEVIPDNKQIFLSAGLYFFKNLNIFVNLSQKFKKKNSSNKKIQIAHLLKDSIHLSYKLKHAFVTNFIDFGDDKKIEEFFFWQNFFKKNFFLKDKKRIKKIFNIIPSAGEGNRHKKLGYKKPKPLIPISGKTMFENSLDRLPNSKENLFIFRKNTFKKFNIKKIFLQSRVLKNFYLIKKKTKGMAETILHARDSIPLNKPVLVSSCDISFIIDYKKFYTLIKKNPDGIIFTWRNYPFADESPNSHAYVKVKNNIVTKISEKKTISKKPNNDFAVTGIFYFNKSNILINCIRHMMKNKITVNNEYYVATSMNKMLKDNLKIYNFEVDQFISWSLPEHLKRYNYWEVIFK